MRLSVLDQSPVSEGSTPAQALRNTVELARLTDRLGYARYWVAEHHATASLASPAPEILIARLGAETTRIRVGSGGVMLPHYSPLKVAEQFRTTVYYADMQGLPYKEIAAVMNTPIGTVVSRLHRGRRRLRRQLIEASNSESYYGSEGLARTA